MDKELVKMLVEASIEFGYNAAKQGVSMEQTKKRYEEILAELLVKWDKVETL